MKNDNCFDLMRTVAALAVLYSHSFALGGLAEPQVGHKTTLGTFAVWIFFAISGYLITQSLRFSATLGEYTAKRVLRIMPALLVLLLISVFIAGPIFSTLGVAEYFSAPKSWTYLFKNPAFANQGELPGVFESLPLANEFNGSLWTIKYELLMYTILACIGFGFRKNARLLIASLTLVLFALTLLNEFSVFEINRVFWRVEAATELRFDRICLLGTMFFCGSILAYRERPPLSNAVASAFVLAIFLARDTLFFRPMAAVLLPLVIIHFSFAASTVFRKLKPAHDLSYGIYLYAFPIQQAAVFMGLRGQEYWGWALIASTIITLAAAYASWVLIERPALNLKSRIRSAPHSPPTARPKE